MPFIEKVDKTVPSTKPVSVREAIPAILVVAFAGFGGILYGWDTGNISGIIAMDYFKRQFGNEISPGVYDLSTSEQSLVVSILSVGTFFGCLMGAYAADKLGRKGGVQAALVVFNVGVAMQVAATALPLFNAGRCLAGLGVGIISTIIPLYQCAPRWIRGACVTGYQWCITIGLLLAAVVDERTSGFDDSRSYRIPIGLQFALAIILSVGFLLLPESPRHLVKKGQVEKAAMALARLNSTDVDSPLVRTEISNIQTNLDVEMTLGNGTYLDCFKTGERKNLQRTLTGMALHALQQLSGINFIFYYGTIFFRSISTGNPFVFTIISNVVNVVTTVPGMYMIERAGRRNIMIFGALWMACAELIVASIGVSDLQGSAREMGSKAQIAFVCIYVAGFASTWGPAAWVICGESFPLAIRAKALSICVATNWLFNWAIGYATPYLVDAIGIKVFFIWFASILVGSVYSYLFIFETANLSLEEVDELYAQTTARKSKALNAQFRAQRTDIEYANAPMPHVGSISSKGDEQKV